MICLGVFTDTHKSSCGRPKTRQSPSHFRRTRLILFNQSSWQHAARVFCAARSARVARHLICLYIITAATSGYTRESVVFNTTDTFKWYLIPQWKLPRIAWPSTGKKAHHRPRSQVLRCPPRWALPWLCLPPAGGSRIPDLSSNQNHVACAHTACSEDSSRPHLGRHCPRKSRSHRGWSMAAMMVAMLPAASMANLYVNLWSLLAGAIRNDRSTHSNGYEGQQTVPIRTL